MALVADSSAIENALIARLGADAALLALMPNGVYYGVAPPGSTRYVTVLIDTSADVAAFGKRAQEDTRYRVHAVGLSSDHPDMRAAAYRIDQLLEDEPIDVDGFVWATLYRVSRIRDADPDPSNPSLTWQYRGGIYRAVFATSPS